MPNHRSGRAKRILYGTAVVAVIVCGQERVLTVAHARTGDVSAASANQPTLELSAGGDHTADSGFGYGALVWAFRRSLYEAGWRLRGMGGFGRYAYDGMLLAGPGFEPQRFRGDVAIREVLLGHQWRWREWFVKAYGGAQYVRHDVRPNDVNNTVKGGATGAKALLEIWYARGKRWASVDTSYATGFGDYRAQIRMGYRARSKVSFGIEAAALGNRDYDAARLGGFLRLHWPGLEATLAAGATGDYIDREPSPYLSLDVVRKY